MDSELIGTPGRDRESRRRLSFCLLFLIYDFFSRRLTCLCDRRDLNLIRCDLSLILVKGLLEVSDTLTQGLSQLRDPIVAKDNEDDDQTKAAAESAQAARDQRALSARLRESSSSSSSSSSAAQPPLYPPRRALNSTASPSAGLRKRKLVLIEYDEEGEAHNTEFQETHK